MGRRASLKRLRRQEMGLSHSPPSAPRPWEKVLVTLLGLATLGALGGWTWSRLRPKPLTLEPYARMRVIRPSAAEEPTLYLIPMEHYYAPETRTGPEKDAEQLPTLAPIQMEIYRVLQRLHDAGELDLVFGEGLMDGEFHFDYLERGWSQADYEAHVRKSDDDAFLLRFFQANTREPAYAAYELFHPAIRTWSDDDREIYKRMNQLNAEHFSYVDRHGVGWGMMHLASHPSRKTRDRLPLATLDGGGVLGPNAKLSHMVYLDDADIARLARRGVKISHCPTAGLKHTKGLAAHARVPEMLAAGVCVSLGGDSGNGSNHFDMLRMMYLVANIYKDARLDVTVMPPETVLEMATIRGAESLLMERRIGSLEPGKRADLVLYDRDQPEWRPLLNPLNNLVYAATGSSVRSVMIDGRLVLDDGRITTVDERAIYERVEVLAREQVRRAGLTIESKWPTTG